MAAKQEEKSSDEEILKIARKRFDLAVEACTDNRREQLDDMKFRAGDQWPADVRQARDLDRRPCLTINRIPQFVRQVTNDQRQNRPSIKVNPVDDNADIDTAKILQGLIRHIENNSNADVAYDTAFEGTVQKGEGYFRIITDFCDPMSFDQEILIKRIRESASVYLDPTYQEPDASDANWGFVFDDLSDDDYKAQYGDSEMVSMADWASLGDQTPGWVSKNTCRVAEYFYKTFKDVTIVLIGDQQGNKKVLDKADLPEKLPDGLQILGERKTTLPAIKWCKINAVEILEKTDWLGQWIPIIPVLGDELVFDGKRILEGIIRHAKDPQRMYNYWASSETETIALAPRAPFIGVEGQFEGHEAQWKTANTKNHAYLEYRPKSIGGQPAGPPTRNVYEPPVQAITQARMQSSEDLKATTGIYDASLGNRSNENSGVAIQRRNAQAQTNNFHYIDNLSRALRHAGRIIVDLIPKVYDTARTVRILGEDGEAEMVKINQVFEEQGQNKLYDLNKGKYDVTVATGPSYATKRQESVASMLDLTKSYPQMAQFAGDLMVRNMDWPGSQEIADRLKAMLPPQIQALEGKDKDKPPIPPEVQQQMAQMGQMIDQLTQHLTQANHKIEGKTLELESKERIEMAKIQAELEIAMAQMGSAEAQALLKHQISEIQHRLDLLHSQEQMDNDNEQAGLQMAAQTQQQPQSTGGPSPGTPMGV